jgi:hypothetical protein
VHDQLRVPGERSEHGLPPNRDGHRHILTGDDNCHIGCGDAGRGGVAHGRVLRYCRVESKWSPELFERREGLRGHPSTSRTGSDVRCVAFALQRSATIEHKTSGSEHNDKHEHHPHARNAALVPMAYSVLTRPGHGVAWNASTGCVSDTVIVRSPGTETPESVWFVTTHETCTVADPPYQLPKVDGVHKKSTIGGRAHKPFIPDRAIASSAALRASSGVAARDAARALVRALLVMRVAVVFMRPR